MSGQHLPIQDCDVLVGEPVFTTGAHARNNLAKKRAECTETTMDIIAHSMGSRRQRTMVASGAAIPQLLHSIQWTRPTVECLERLRRKTVRIHWGNNRGTRCAEIVLALLTNPARDDPVGALFATRIRNLRVRLLSGADRIIEFTRQWKARADLKDLRKSTSPGRSRDRFSDSTKPLNGSSLMSHAPTGPLSLPLPMESS